MKGIVIVQNLKQFKDLCPKPLGKISLKIKSAQKCKGQQLFSVKLFENLYGHGALQARSRTRQARPLHASRWSDLGVVLHVLKDGCVWTANAFAKMTVHVTIRGHGVGV